MTNLCRIEPAFPYLKPEIHPLANPVEYREIALEFREKRAFLPTKITGRVQKTHT
jgi:hypothetical protein